LIHVRFALSNILFRDYLHRRKLPSKMVMMRRINAAKTP